MRTFKCNRVGGEETTRACASHLLFEFAQHVALLERRLPLPLRGGGGVWGRLWGGCNVNVFTQLLLKRTGHLLFHHNSSHYWWRRRFFQWRQRSDIRQWLEIISRLLRVRSDCTIVLPVRERVLWTGVAEFGARSRSWRAPTWVRTKARCLVATRWNCDILRLSVLGSSLTNTKQQVDP